MPAALNFDTLKFAKRLTDAGMDQRMAEAIVLGLKDADTSELVTKTDLAEFKVELFRFLYMQAVTIVGLTTGITVGLIKILPG